MEDEKIIIYILFVTFIALLFLQLFISNNNTKERIKILLEQQSMLEKSISELIVSNFDKLDTKFERSSSNNINNLSMIREKMSLIDRAQQNITSLTENVVDLKNFLSNTTQRGRFGEMILENLVKDLEELTNEYLAELSDGRFSLEFVVLNDKLNVEIDDNGKPVDILALSAGELARVNTSTLLAIRKLMSSISKSRINALFLDEVTNVLDELGKEKLVEILLREENLNTYIVSHGWTHPLLSKIEVIKEDKVSHLDG